MDFRWVGMVRCNTWGGKVRSNSAAKNHPSACHRYSMKYNQKNGLVVLPHCSIAVHIKTQLCCWAHAQFTIPPKWRCLGPKVA